MQDDLAKKVGPLHFAGEHTEFPHSWMDVAIKSGVRAAAELHLNDDWTLKRGVRYNRRPMTPRRKSSSLSPRMKEVEWKKHHPGSLFQPEFSGI